MSRIVHLDQHVSRVDARTLELLDSPRCNVLILSDVQVAVLAQMTFPYAYWSTRLVLDHDLGQQTVDFPQSYLDELECLELLLSGGDTMTCDLSGVLTELATAIRTSGRGGNGCAGGGPAVILDCLSQMTPDEIVPEAPQDAPQYGVPPSGFDTWAQYEIHKCKAAHAIVDATANIFGALSLAPPVVTTAVAVNTLLTGTIGGIALAGVVFPPAALVAIVAGAVALGLLEGAAYIYLQEVRQYIFDNRADFACALYQSGSAVAAQEAVGIALDDAIQSVGWTAIFGPAVGGEIAAILGGIAAGMDTTNLVNPLFRVVEDFVYPDVSCECDAPGCEAQTIADFTIDLDGAELINPTGGLGYLEWDDSVSPPGASALCGQSTGHTDVFSGWVRYCNFVVPATCWFQWRQVLSTNVTCHPEAEINGSWESLGAGDFSGDSVKHVDMSAFAGDWCTGVRWTGGKADGVAWQCHIPSVTVECE